MAPDDVDSIPASPELNALAAVALQREDLAWSTDSAVAWLALEEMRGGVFCLADSRWEAQAVARAKRVKEQPKTLDLDEVAALRAHVAAHPGDAMAAAYLASVSAEAPSTIDFEEVSRTVVTRGETPALAVARLIVKRALVVDMIRKREC